MEQNKIYAAIDLKSFYASVECVDRGLDPLLTNLVVADSARTQKTICLAVSPSLKSYGISGRARLFEVVSRIKEVNAARQRQIGGRRLSGRSVFDNELVADNTLAVDYIVAPPRMALYKKISTEIVQIYMKYVSMEDIQVYSVDEVIIDITPYLRTSGLSPRDFVRRMIKDVLRTKGITATAGIGTNTYLCKVAMDIMAKHTEPDEDGVRIAELDEMSYRRMLWDHRPLTDFWRVGRGYAKALEAKGLYTMGDIARCSVGRPNELHNEELLYRMFGVNAELLIDHAWGWEPCTIKDIKSYKPQSNSISSGQVLKYPYTYDKAEIVIREMTDALVLDLVEKDLVTDQIVLTVGYDVDNLTDPNISGEYDGEITTDHYGRKVPKHAHGTANLGGYSSSTKQIIKAVSELYGRIINKKLLIRRINVTANHVIGIEDVKDSVKESEQMNMFVDYEAVERQKEQEKVSLEREKKMQRAVIDIKKKYGKNAILKGMNLQEGATAKERNGQIGGHKA